MAETQDLNFEEISEDIQVQASKYIKKDNKDDMNILIVGKEKVGKSTLVSNMIRNLKGGGDSAEEDRLGVYEHTCSVYGVPIHIFDTPGLNKQGIDKKAVIKEIRERTQGSITLMIYVSSLSDPINEGDNQIIHLFTEEFSPQIWEHTILVLSYMYTKLDRQHVTRDIQTFQRFLESYNSCQKLTVQLIDAQNERKGLKNIPVISFDLNEDVWYSRLVLEIFHKFDEKGHKSFILPTTTRNNIFGFATSGAAYGGALGAAVASAIGTTTSTVFATNSWVIATTQRYIYGDNLIIDSGASYIPQIRTVTTPASIRYVVMGAAVGVGFAVGGFAITNYIRSNRRTQNEE